MSGRRSLSRSDACFTRSDDVSSELWHSTPVKTEVMRASELTGFRLDHGGHRLTGEAPPTFDAARRAPGLQEAELPVSALSGSTLQRQRRELQLLVAELKDRERELNAMAAAHHKQHRIWEQDRQRAAALQQRSVRTDDELQKRNEVIRALSSRVWEAEAQEKEAQKEVKEARQQLAELQKEQQHVREACGELEEKNQSLSAALTALSNQVGSLQVREEELSSMLRLKEKDVTDADGQSRQLAGRLADLETRLQDSRCDAEDNRRRCRDAKHEAARLREELQQQVIQSSTQREEIIRLKQELQLLHRDFILSGGDSLRDELLELSRSKQERLSSELRCLRQVCEEQQSELQLLRLNPDSSRDTLTPTPPHRPAGSPCSCLDHQPPPSERGSHAGATRADPPPPRGADVLRRPTDSALASAPPPDDGRRLSSCALQQLLDESRLAAADVGSPRRRLTFDPSHQSQPAHHCHAAASPEA